VIAVPPSARSSGFFGVTLSALVFETKTALHCEADPTRISRQKRGPLVRAQTYTLRFNEGILEKPGCTVGIGGDPD
jgi:hypothetical protein